MQWDMIASSSTATHASAEVPGGAKVAVILRLGAALVLPFPFGCTEHRLALGQRLQSFFRDQPTAIFPVQAMQAEVVLSLIEAAQCTPDMVFDAVLEIQPPLGLPLLRYFLLSLPLLLFLR